MAAINSRQKGKVGELELAAFLRQWGYVTRRGAQYKGGPDSPDVIGVDGLHIECKRVERFNPYQALDQAIKDAKVSDIPVVMHRANRREWIAVLPLHCFLDLLDHGLEKSDVKRNPEDPLPEVEGGTPRAQDGD